MEDSVSALLIQLCRAHRRIADAKLNEIGLYAGQEALLLCLAANQGISQRELSEQLDVEAATITKTLNRLQKAGFITRKPDPDDGRVSRVYITDEGQRLYGGIQATWQAINSQLLQGTSELEVALLRRILAQLLENLERS